MKRYLLTTAMLLLCCVLTGCGNPGTGPGTGGPGPTPPPGIRFDNVNDFGDNTAIRVWILTESQIQNPPTTKAAADDLESFVSFPFRRFYFPRSPGNYFVVASNETYYQGLDDKDPFVAGQDFSLLQVAVAGELEVVEASNTDTPALLPALIQP